MDDGGVVAAAGDAGDVCCLIRRCEMASLSNASSFEMASLSNASSLSNVADSWANLGRACMRMRVVCAGR